MTATTVTKPAPGCKPWRDVLPIHPAASDYPRIDGQALAELGADIKARGLQVEIVLIKEGGKDFLLDGISRLDALEGTGIELVTKDGKLDPTLGLGAGRRVRTVADVDPYELAASLNAHRRHLTAEDRRKRIEALVAADPAKSDRAIAKAAKVDHKTVAAVRANKEATGEIPQLTARTGADGKDGIQVRELREVMLQDALTELQHVQRKYESVVELAGVWAKVDRARRKTVSGKARKEERAGAA